ncbi:hypothetical protein ACXA45_04815, partial [Neomicrococcus lactis]
LRSQTTDTYQTSTKSLFRFRVGDLSNLQPFFSSVKFTLCDPDRSEYLSDFHLGRSKATMFSS